MEQSKSNKFSSFYIWNDNGLCGFWFRIFGYGLSINNAPLLFSQRHGFTKYLLIGKFKIEFLKPIPTKRKIKICYTCCNACHKQHRNKFTAYVHRAWLNLTGRI